MMRRFYFACGLIAVLCGMAALVDAQDTTYVGSPWYDVVKLDRRTQADTLTILEHFVPPSYSTLPTCDADTEPAIGFDETDNLTKQCSDQTGTFQWDPIGRDRDQDGFRNDIDGDPDVAATGYDTPVSYQVTTTYSGTDARITHNSQTAYLRATTTAVQSCVALAVCKEKTGADLTAVSSFTVGTASGYYNLSGASNTCGSASNLADFLAGDDALDTGTYQSGSNSGIIIGATCLHVEGT